MYPAAYPDVMAVGAVDRWDQRARFSNQGAYIAVAAPGVDIYNTYKSGQYKQISGTSQAAPHVAGLAALIWARNPSYDAGRVRSAIQATAVDLGAPGWDQQFGWGRINVLSAVALARTATPALRPTAVASNLSPPDFRGSEIISGRVLVRLRPGLDVTSVDEALRAFGGLSIESHISELGLRVLRVPDGQEWSAVERLRTLPGVQYAEPDYVIRLFPRSDLAW
jgi:subtilisin family serine protease